MDRTRLNINTHIHWYHTKITETHVYTDTTIYITYQLLILCDSATQTDVYLHLN